VAPGNIFLPEANLPWEDARKGWLEPERTFAGQVENTAGDVLISFDVHRAIWDSLLKEDRSAWHKVQTSLGELPSHKSLLVYLGLHDETLIDDPELRKQLLDAGFHDFAGRGVGDAPAQLLGGNADRLAMAHVLLYSSKGHPAVYYRTVVGSMNNDAYYDAMKADRLAAQGENKDEKKARDSRDFDRGGVLISDYERALREGYKPAITIRALNALWEKNEAVRTNNFFEMADGDAQVVSFARVPSGETEKPLLQLVNLSGQKKTLTYRMERLEENLRWTPVKQLVDLLATEIDGKERKVPYSIKDGMLTIELEPYECVYLENRDV
jgi:glycosidase